MITYRITKYNPIYRDKDGVYLKDEWTAISDIGKSFGKKKLTYMKYLKVEGQYLKALERILSKIDLNTITINEIEKYFYKVNDNTVKDLYDENMKILFNKLSDNYCFTSKDELMNAIKLILREHLWGKIVVKNSNFKVEFGNDLYVYITSEELPKELIQSLSNIGVFIEEV
jgi:hypothetical protein